MPEYTPPTGDNVDFELAAYTLPLDGSDVDFELGGGFIGDGGVVVGGSATVEVFRAVRPGESHVDIHNAANQFQGTLTPLHYKISRYENAVGSWSCNLPLDEVITDGVPLAAQITYGWKISIRQENFTPLNAPETNENYLLYQGIVEVLDFKIDQGGNAYLSLSGSFRTYALVRRSVLRNWEFSGTLKQLTTSLVGTLLDPYGPVFTSSAGNRVAGKFSYLSRFTAWARGAVLGRHIIRETWDHDRPEIVRYDGPPDSGLTFRVANDSEKGGDAASIAARYAHDTGETGVALIAGTPGIKFDGASVVNRIVSLGVDTVVDPEDPEGTVTAELTLQRATYTSPYVVQSGINPDGSDYYYLEDAESIALYGLTETVLSFSEVKNPNNDSASRAQAANVLYMKTVNVLINSRSPKVEVTLNPIANGSRIWALPGDSAILEYHGEVETESGASVWMEMDKRFLISERHDESHPSGIRRVGYKLIAPELEFPVPNLPDLIVLPPETPCEILESSDPGPSTPDCPSPSPITDENDGPGFPDEVPPEPPEEEDPLFARFGGRQLNVISSNAGVEWTHKIDGSMDWDPALPAFGFSLPSLGAGTWTVTTRVSWGLGSYWGPATYETRIVSGSTVLEAFPQTIEAGFSNLTESSGGFPFAPTLGVEFADGDYSTIGVTIVRTGGTGLLSVINHTLDSYIKFSFVPD